MATLVVRRLDDHLVLRLKKRARAVGRSAEAEHRLILEEALRRHASGAELWTSLRGDGPWLDREFDDAVRAHDQPAEWPDLERRRGLSSIPT